eukprot:141118-Pleurochrysis_carterae.AAC.1
MAVGTFERTWCFTPCLSCLRSSCHVHSTCTQCWVASYVRLACRQCHLHGSGRRCTAQRCSPCTALRWPRHRSASLLPPAKQPSAMQSHTISFFGSQSCLEAPREYLDAASMIQATNCWANSWSCRARRDAC